MPPYVGLEITLMDKTMQAWRLSFTWMSQVFDLSSNSPIHHMCALNCSRQQDDTDS